MLFSSRPHNFYREAQGDWRGISKDYVTTRTPTQVASHAQKYFIRHNNQSKRKRRTSLFDLKAGAEVLETVCASTRPTLLCAASLVVWLRKLILFLTCHHHSRRHEISLQGSAEATSTTWPERATQRSSSVSHAVHNTHTTSQQQAGDHLDRSAVASHSNAAAFPGMWYQQGMFHSVKLIVEHNQLLLCC